MPDTSAKSGQTMIFLMRIISMKYRNDLTADRVRELFDYDATNGSLSWKKPGRGRRPNLIAGNKQKNGYSKTWVDGSYFYNHRIIWLWVTGSWPKQDIDHINCDPSDNRFENLRVVSCSTNHENLRSPCVGNTSGYLGVSWDSYNQIFKAQIKANGKHFHIGCFTDPADAHAAYVSAKRKLHAGCTI